MTFASNLCLLCLGLNAISRFGKKYDLVYPIKKTLFVTWVISDFVDSVSLYSLRFAGVGQRNYLVKVEYNTTNLGTIPMERMTKIAILVENVHWFDDWTDWWFQLDDLDCWNTRYKVKTTISVKTASRLYVEYCTPISDSQPLLLIITTRSPAPVPACTSSQPSLWVGSSYISMHMSCELRQLWHIRRKSTSLMALIRFFAPPTPSKNFLPEKPALIIQQTIVEPILKDCYSATITAYPYWL
jgi:hypothetical protein